MEISQIATLITFVLPLVRAIFNEENNKSPTGPPSSTIGPVFADHPGLIYRNFEYFRPDLETVRSLTAVTFDLMYIYWTLRRTEIVEDYVYAQYNKRLQELHFERLLGLDRTAGTHNVEGVDNFMRDTYQALYTRIASFPEVSKQEKASSIMPYKP